MTHSNIAPTRVAVIGCGRMGAITSDETLAKLKPGWAPLNYAEAVRRTPGLELVALCDRSESHLEEAAKVHAVVKRFSDHRALLDQEEPDIAIISTRTPGRGGIICDCIDAGVGGVLFEKPLATSMSESRPVLSLLRESLIPFAFGTLRRFSETYRKARDMVEAGEIGELRSITVEHGYDMLMWGHPHSIDLMIYFSRCHEADEVRADCEFEPNSISDQRIDCDPMLKSASIRFSNGIEGTISRINGHNTHLIGTGGTLSIRDDGAYLDLAPPGETPRPIELPQPKLSCTQRAVLELAEAVRGERSPALTPDEIEANQRLLMAIARSAQTGGAKTNPNEVSGDFTVTSRFGELTA